jgi:cytochrome oxidase assembly protein ShyY1
VRALWVRWTLLIVFVAILGTVFVNLGDWQLRRLHDRRERNSITVANEARPIRPFEQVFTHPLVQADEWQRVEARGTFDSQHQFVVRYRSLGDSPSYSVVTPLRTAAGTVLVNRGLIPLSSGNQVPAAGPPPPSGEVTVVGHVRLNEQGRRSAVMPAGGSVRYINSDALATALPYPVLNGYIGALTVNPPQQGGFVPVATPELSDGPHFWYAIQWFLFTALAVLGIVVFIRGDLRERRDGGQTGRGGSGRGRGGSGRGPGPGLTSRGAGDGKKGGSPRPKATSSV